jgi:hypothetical protein
MREYLANGRNAAAAYRAAYETQCSAKIASAEGNKLLKHPGITLALQASVQAAASKLNLTAELGRRPLFDIAELEPRYNIAPSQPLLAVRAGAEGKP